MLVMQHSGLTLRVCTTAALLLALLHLSSAVLPSALPVPGERRGVATDKHNIFASIIMQKIIYLARLYSYNHNYPFYRNVQQWKCNFARRTILHEDDC